MKMIKTLRIANQPNEHILSTERPAETVCYMDIPEGVKAEPMDPVLFEHRASMVYGDDSPCPFCVIEARHERARAGVLARR